MATRDGMSNLIGRLRRLVDDSGTAVWSAQQLQDILDEHKRRVYREELEPEVTYTSGTSYAYKVYHSRHGNYEEGGTAYFQVEASNGAQRGTADYTPDYIRGVVTMGSDQAGTQLYLSGWSYDLNGAAADCWRERASNVASYYNVTADGHNLSRGDWFKHCLEMAKDFETRGEAITVRAW